VKILLAPSEKKSIDDIFEESIGQDSFILPHLYKQRYKVIKAYEDYIQTLGVTNLSKWFGIKKFDEAIKLQASLNTRATSKAIQRYQGVAFEALDYEYMNENAQKYIDENVIIFSNLFGPISAKDHIPYYKFKQGAKIPNFNVESYYKEHFTDALDKMIGQEVIDLRATFYEKFYTPTSATTIKFKFIKDGKSVSHYAKYYRGKMLRLIAKNNIKNLDELLKIPFNELAIKEIIEKKKY
jgi:cytoplasmic iron level regulating protein YaaA (DUF328/UPF0246 family)